MKIGIIGGGAIGLLFAGYLQKNHQVMIYTRTVEQKLNLLKHGLYITKDQHTSQIEVEAKLMDEWKEDDDLTLITVKQYQLPQVMEKIMAQGNQENSFLFLQNGMGHLKWLEKLVANNIYVGTVEHGAIRESNNHVRFTGKGKTKLAIYHGEDSLLTKLMEPVNPEFPFEVEEDYYEMLISKLIINAVINPLTAVLKVKNGELVNNPYYYRVLIQVFEEVIDVLQIHNRSRYFGQLLQVCRNTAANRSSMLKDIEENRQTEVDSILGYLLEKALKEERKAPLLMAFYHCVKGSEQ